MPSEGTDIAKLAFSVDVSGAQETIKSFIDNDLSKVSKAVAQGTIGLARELGPNGKLGKKLTEAMNQSTRSFEILGAKKGLAKFFGNNNELSSKIRELTNDVNTYAHAFASLSESATKNVNNIISEFGRLSSSAQISIDSLAVSFSKAFSTKALNKDTLGELLNTQFKSVLDTEQKIGKAQALARVSSSEKRRFSSP